MLHCLFLDVSPEQLLPPLCSWFRILLLEIWVPHPHVFVQDSHLPHCPHLQSTERGNMGCLDWSSLLTNCACDLKQISFHLSHTWARIPIALLCFGFSFHTVSSSILRLSLNPPCWNLSSPSTCLCARCPSAPLSPLTVYWKKENMGSWDWSTCCSCWCSSLSSAV